MGRRLIVWTLFGVGHALSRLPWYPYRVYNWFMITSGELQIGDAGPWRKPPAPRVDELEAAAARKVRD